MTCMSLPWCMRVLLLALSGAFATPSAAISNLKRSNDMHADVIAGHMCYTLLKNGNLFLLE